MSARSKARELQARAERDYENAKRRRVRAHQRLEDAAQGRARVVERRVAPALERFQKAMCAFAEVRVSEQHTDDGFALAPFDDPALRRLEGAAGAALRTAGLGGVLGGAGAVGTYSAVAAYGTASTGTAIATLHGVAATNATFAALGGGSLASGGGGMLAGQMLLGGIAAAPVLLVGGIVYWRRGQQMLDQARVNAADIRAAIAKLDADVERLHRVRALVERLTGCATALCAALEARVAEIETWSETSIADCSRQQQGYLARTVAIAETLLVVSAVPAWSERGNPTRRGPRAARAAEALLSEAE